MKMAIRVKMGIEVHIYGLGVYKDDAQGRRPEKTPLFGRVGYVRSRGCCMCHVRYHILLENIYLCQNMIMRCVRIAYVFLHTDQSEDGDQSEDADSSA